MNRIFVVRIRGSTLLFSEEKFWEFCKRSKTHDWTFVFGEIDSNEPLIDPHNISIPDFPNIFDMEKVKPLLKYRMTKYGSHLIYDMPFFKKAVYMKYGERIGWNEQY